MDERTSANRSASLFKHPVLDKLTHTHIAVPLTIYFAGSAAILYRGLSHSCFTPWQGMMVFFAGILFWTFFEYIAHRYLFHMHTRTALRKRVQYLFHGVHHDDPRDKSRLAMPPAASVLILTALFFVIRLIMGSYVWAFLPGFVTGYSLYLIVHYAVHAYRPPKNILHILWVNHSIHHHKDDTVAYGVSSPLWDYIMGTAPLKTYQRKRHKGGNDSPTSAPGRLRS